MISNRTSIQSNTRTRFPINPIWLIGFAAVGLTDAPTSANKAINTLVNTQTMSQVAYKKDEEDYCPNTNEFSLGSYRKQINMKQEPTSTSSFDTFVAFEDAEEISYKQFLAKFDIQAKKNADFITISFEDAKLAFQKTARHFAAIPFKVSSVDLLPRDGFKVILKLSESKVLIASQYMVDSDIPADNVVFSLYQGRSLVESNILPIDKFVSHILA